jgi:hypothetical protein
VKCRKERKKKEITEDWGKEEETKKLDRNNIKKQRVWKLRRKREVQRLKKERADVLEELMITQLLYFVFSCVIVTGTRTVTPSLQL